MQRNLSVRVTRIILKMEAVEDHTASAPKELPKNPNIKDGDSVILKKGKSLKVFQIRKTRDIWLDGTKFSLDGIIGHCYGSKFEVIKGKMVKIDKSANIKDEASGADGSKGIDNRHLHDSNSNQKLGKDDIEKMKKEGLQGKEIIDQLIEHSSTFKGKTEYSQEKWIKKKEKKHLLEYTVLKPNTRLLCEMYTMKSPSKICFIRMDTVAQILTQGNIHAHSTVAVVDNCLGLIVGAVMERLGGFGRVIHIYPGESPVRPAIDNFNFPEEFMKKLYSFPLNQVNSLKNKDSLESDNSPDSCTGETHSSVEGCVGNGKELSELTKKEQNCENESAMETDETKTEDNENKSKTESEENKPQKRDRTEREIRRDASRLLKAQNIKESREILLERKLDGLIVATKFHPTPIVLELIDYVAYSRPIVVYSQYKEPLMDCYAFLREKGGLINFRLTEAWLRDYQVLEMRTHPVIQMSGGGGYLLTATTMKKS